MLLLLMMMATASQTKRRQQVQQQQQHPAALRSCPCLLPHRPGPRPALFSWQHVARSLNPSHLPLRASSRCHQHARAHPKGRQLRQHTTHRAFPLLLVPLVMMRAVAVVVVVVVMRVVVVVPLLLLLVMVVVGGCLAWCMTQTHTQTWSYSTLFDKWHAKQLQKPCHWLMQGMMLTLKPPCGPLSLQCSVVCCESVGASAAVHAAAGYFCRLGFYQCKQNGLCVHLFAGDDDLCKHHNTTRAACQENCTS
jgi:hypothetical protein